MPIAFQTALISAGVAILTAALGAFLTWNQIKQERERIQHEREQIQQERQKWLVDIKTTYAVELYKARLAAYAQVWKLLMEVSNRAENPMTAEKAKQVALQLNAWLYDVGGMCAEASTRGALLGLREALFSWAAQGNRPADFYSWRNMALLLLRRDLDVQGLESFDPKDRGSLLEKLKAEFAPFQ